MIGLLKQPPYRNAAWLWPALRLAALLLAAGDARAQTAVGDAFQAFPLQHISAAEIEPQLSKLLSGLPTPTEVVADPKSNRLLVRGAPQTLPLVRKLISALDRQPAADGSQTQVIPVGGPNNGRIRAAMSVLQPSAGIATPAAATPAMASVPGGRVPLMARVFQQPNQQPAPAQPQPAAPTPAQPAAPMPPVVPPVAQPAAVPPAVAMPGADPNEPLTSGLVGPVQIEFLDGLDVMIVTGGQRDVERVMRIINDIERLSVETEPVIEVLQLEHAGSEAIAAIITPLYDQVLSPRQGRVSITALVKPNALLLIGRAESVKALAELIKRIDQPVEPASQFAVFPLKHASAATATATITEFFAERQGLGPKVVVTADFRTNAVIVQASPRDLAEVGELLKRIDTDASEAVHELRVFPLQNSLADELAPVLQDAINGQASGGTTTPGVGGLAALAGQAAPAVASTSSGKATALRMMTIDSKGQRRLDSGILTEVRVTADSRANALLVTGPPSAMELIEALIKQLDQIPAAEAQIKVFTIVNGDAASLVRMLETLFGQQSAAGGGFGGQRTGAASFQGENPLVALRFSVDERTNSIIASGSSGDLTVVEAMLLRLDASDVRQRQTAVYRLKNSPANDVSNAVNNFLRSQREVQQISPGTLSPFEQIEREVIVVPEPVSNSLIVSATPRYYSEIQKLVEDLDARPPMVMIQVLIAEVALNGTDEFGVELGVQDSVLFDRSLLSELVTTTNSTQQPQGNTVITTTNQIIQSALNTPGYVFNNQNFGNSGSTNATSNSPIIGGQGLSNFSVGRANADLGYGGLVLSASSRSVSILLRALQESRRLDVLSRPQIMTLDNQPAYIQVGSRVPRVQGVTITPQVGQTSNVRDEPVGLILGVTPRISPDNLVVMEIDTEKSALGKESEGVPIFTGVNGQVVRQPLINNTTAQTTVSAANGQTVVLGGLITKTNSVTHRRVPVLSKIPILGHLFRYDNETTQRTELLIIMTPHIVRNEADADAIKHAETARISWCLADVVRMHGDIGLMHRGGDWPDQETAVIYPDGMPIQGETVPTPSTGEPAVVVPPSVEPGSPSSQNLPPPRLQMPTPPAPPVPPTRNN